MKLQRFTSYLLQHRLIALLLTFAIAFVPVFSILGIILAAFMTLTKGVIEGAIFTLVATLPYFITVGLPGHHADGASLVVWAAIGVAVLSNLLTWVFAVMLRKQSTWSQILQVAALMGLLVVSVVHLANPNIDIWWGKQLQTFVNAEKINAASTTPSSVAKDLIADSKAALNLKTTGSHVVDTTVNSAIAATNQQADAVDPSTNVRLEAINQTKMYATGLLAAAILFNALMQLVVARWWQAILYYPRGLRRELHGIRLSLLASVLFVAALVLAYMGNLVVVDMMPIVYLLFTAAGLSLVHWIFGINKSKSTWFWIIFLYVGLFISIPVSLIFMSCLAAIDVWFNVRKRFHKF